MRAALLLLAVCFLSACAPTQQQDVSSPLPDVSEQNGVLLLSADDLPVAVQAFHPLFVLFDSPARNGSLELFHAFSDAAVALRASQRELAPRMRFASVDATQLSSKLQLPEVLSTMGLPAMLRFRCSPKVMGLAESSASTPAPAASNVSGTAGVDDTTTATTTIIITTTTVTAAAASTLTECSLDDADVDAYTDGRSSAEFQRFMLEQPQKEVTLLYDRLVLEALVASHPFVVLIVVDGSDTQPYFDASSLAQADVHVVSSYAVSANRDLLDSNEERQRIPSVVVFRDFGNTRIVYTGPWKKSAIVSFLQLNKYSLVSTYTPQFSGFLFDSHAAAHVLLFSDASKSYHELLRSQAQELAQPYASALNGAITLRFVFVPIEESALRAAMFVTDRHVPMVLIVQDVNAPPYRYPVFGQGLVAALGDLSFKYAFSALLSTKFPQVFSMADGGLDGGVVIDNSPGFEDTPTTPKPSSSQAPSVAIVMEDPSPSRLLREVEVSAMSEEHKTLSPWKLISEQQQNQQLGPVTDVSSALWVLRQQTQSHVVVCFSSPRCYACREFAKVFEQVTQRAIDALSSKRISSATGGTGTDTKSPAPAVVFAKVNVDVVDIALLQLDFDRLPGLFVFPRGRGAAPIAYTSRQFTVPDVLAFVEESCFEK
ncbi:hypothetical protein Gpo141_00001012 [Globisporangium polare]